MEEPKYKKSPIDELFKELYGYYPPKAGQSYEMIVSATFKLLLNKDVSYNQFIRGNYSDTVYQLDGLLQAENYPIEAKDYTIDDRKVGRRDLQILQGSLNDLNVDKALFASATDFTKPAKKYSNAPIPNHKPIELFHVRPVVEEDKNGRITKIVFNMHAHWADYYNAKYNFVWTKQSIEKLKEDGYDGKEMEMILQEFYNSEGNVLITIHELTEKSPPGTTFEKDFVSKGCWILNGGHLKLGNKLYELKGLEYAIPFTVADEVFVIDVTGEPKIYIKSENGSIDKLISDKELKKIRFIDGKVKESE